MRLSFPHSWAEECEVFIGQLRIFWSMILSQWLTCNSPLAGSLNTGWHILASLWLPVVFSLWPDSFNVLAYLVGMFFSCLQSVLGFVSRDFFLDTDVIPSHWDLRRGVSRTARSQTRAGSCSSELSVVIRLLQWGPLGSFWGLALHNSPPPFISTQGSSKENLV